jgi:hypothetical protein
VIFYIDNARICVWGARYTLGARYLKNAVFYLNNINQPNILVLNKFVIFTWLSFLVLQLLKRRLRNPCFPRNFKVLIYDMIYLLTAIG